MTPITPRQLKYFVEIASAGSISAASATLRIAQPALSQHVAAMELELGVALFERHARGVALTTEGKRLLDRASSLLAQFDGLKADVTAPIGHPCGPVRLCAAGALATAIAAPLYRQVEETLPEVRLLLSTALSTEVRAAVESRRVDLALMPNAFELPNLSVLPVYEESFYLFGLATLFDETTAPIRFADIGTRPLVAPDRDHDLRRLIERTAVAQSCPLNVRYELNNPELGLALVRDGLAFAVMPQSANIDMSLRGTRRICAREIVEPRLSRVQSIVSVVDPPRNAAVAAVSQAMVTVMRQLIRKGALKGAMVGHPSQGY